MWNRIEHESGLPDGKWKDEERGVGEAHEIEEEDETGEQSVTVNL